MRLIKERVLAATAALCGAVVGSLATPHFAPPRSLEVESIEARRLTILDERGKVTARLASSGGSSVLSFYDSGMRRVLDVGVEDSGASRFIRLFDTNGEVVAGLNSLPPHGEATLYLGDDRWHSRIVIGALISDVAPAASGTAEWGLELRQPRSSRSLFTALVRTPTDSSESTVGVSLVRPDGTLWHP